MSDFAKVSDTLDKGHSGRAMYTNTGIESDVRSLTITSSSCDRVRDPACTQRKLVGKYFPQFSKFSCLFDVAVRFVAVRWKMVDAQER